MASTKEILANLKALFNAPVVEPVVAPVVAPVAPITLNSVSYKTADGTSVDIAQAGETPAIGDAVTTNGTPVAEGTIVLEDGSSISVDAAGIITAVTPVTPATVEVPAAIEPPVVAPIVAPVQLSLAANPTELKAILDKFALGTPEERLANLEIVAKALMEQCMGYELREAERKASTEQAIAIYKQGLAAAESKNDKLTQTIEGMFELCEQMAATETAVPATLTGANKDKFDRSNKREARLQKMSEAFKQIKTESKY